MPWLPDYGLPILSIKQTSLVLAAPSMHTTADALILIYGTSFSPLDEDGADGAVAACGDAQDHSAPIQQGEAMRDAMRDARG